VLQNDKNNFQRCNYPRKYIFLIKILKYIATVKVDTIPIEKI
jgi:hypothetical protein